MLAVGVMGYIVERLPPGRQCVANDDDKLSLSIYLDAVAWAQNLDRHAVRAAAEHEFSSAAIIEGVIAALDELRAVTHRLRRQKLMLSKIFATSLYFRFWPRVRSRV